METFSISGSVIESKQDNSVGKVTIITPTTRDREDFNKRVRAMIKLQDYNGEIEHLIGYGAGTIGMKRNELCSRATSEMILHMDSDDLYAPDWISRAVSTLVESKADVTGLSNAWFYDTQNGQLYEYAYSGDQPYVCGATMCYWRKTWERNRFPDISAGEDRQFLTNAGKIIPTNYKDGFVATLHGANTCSHLAVKFGVKEMKKASLREMPALLKAHLPMPRR